MASIPTPAALSPGVEPPAAGPAADVVARVADFAPLTPAPGDSGLASLEYLLGVTVKVTAELGRVTRPIGEVLKYGIGAVVELDRSVEEPVDLFVQGVRIARGEVVVINDRFAVRITEIVDPKRPGVNGGSPAS